MKIKKLFENIMKINVIMYINKKHKNNLAIRFIRKLFIKFFLIFQICEILHPSSHLALF